MAKQGTVAWLGLGFDNNAAADGAYFNLGSGAIGTVAAGTTATIQTLQNGWYRCTVTKTYSSANHYLSFEVHSANAQSITWNAAGTENIYVFGGQSEAGAFPTSYIPTTTVAVPRSADVMSGSNVNGLMGVSRIAGTISIKFQALPGAGTQPANTVLVEGDGSTGADDIYFNGSVIRILARPMAVATLRGDFNGGVTPGTAVSQASGSYGWNPPVASANGVAPNAPVALGQEPVGTKWWFGSRAGTSLFFNGWILGWAFYPVQLPQAIQNSLTSAKKF